MNIEELLQKKKNAEEVYNQQLAESEKERHSKVYDGLLKELQREIDIIDELIKIYINKNSAKPHYLEMKLEIVYLWAMSEKTKDEYFNLSDKETIELSDGLFPEGWGYDSEAYPIEKEIEYLEKAIIKDMSLQFVEEIERTKEKGIRI